MLGLASDRIDKGKCGTGRVERGRISVAVSPTKQISLLIFYGAREREGTYLFNEKKSNERIGVACFVDGEAEVAAKQAKNICVSFEYPNELNI